MKKGQGVSNEVEYENVVVSMVWMEIWRKLKVHRSGAQLLLSSRIYFVLSLATQ